MVTTRCACGASTEGEPWANGWVSKAPAGPSEREWICPACFAGRVRAHLFREAVAHEETLS